MLISLKIFSQLFNADQTEPLMDLPTHIPVNLIKVLNNFNMAPDEETWLWLPTRISITGQSSKKTSTWLVTPIFFLYLDPNP